jgi:DNA polymerase III subunit epsilon
MTLTGWRDRWFPSPDLDGLAIWALDLEMSGLQADRDRILSVGMVPIRGSVIRYGERYSSLVRPPDLDRLSNEGLRAHHLIRADLEHAPPLDAVLPEIDRRLREGALLLHFASLDLAFLRRAYRACGLAWPAPAVVDTVELLLRLHQRRLQWTPHAAPPQTTLADAREALGLPAHESHDAMGDALATAELYLVLRHRLGAFRLRDIRT